MKIDIHLWSHLAQFFLEWEMFHKKTFQRNLNEVIPLCMILYIFINLPYIFRQHNLKFKFTATCFDLHKSSFRHAYEPWLLQSAFAHLGSQTAYSSGGACTPRTHRNSILQLHCIYTENCKPSGIPNAQKQIVIVKVHRHAWMMTYVSWNM